jgi:alcohol dehydrogenase class IV
MAQDGSPETVFTYGAPQLKFGSGASDEIGYDLSTYGVRRVLVITDPGVAATGHPQRIVEQIGGFGIEAVLFDRSRVEPTDASMVEAVEFARERGPWDAFVAVGGGSAIDTAKAVNLLAPTPASSWTTSTPGRAGPRPENPLRRWSPCPPPRAPAARARRVRARRAGQKVKSGISHPRLRPTLAVVDPRLT